MYDEDVDEAVGALERVGVLDEIRGAVVRRKVKSGAATFKGAVAAALGAGGPGSLPSPNFGVTAPETLRRAPLGFLEDGTNAVGWSLAAVLGDTTTIRAKVSRPTHINRLLLVASATGAVIISLKIGDVEQMLNGAVPVELYGTSALTDPVPDNFDPLKSGTDCVIVLQNTTAGAITGTAGAKAACER